MQYTLRINFYKKNIMKTLLNITLKERIYLNKKDVTPVVMSFLKKKLIFANSEYILKKKIGKSTYGTVSSFNLIRERKDHIVIPRGMIKELLTFLKNKNIEYTLTDSRMQKEDIAFEDSINLFDYQKETTDRVLKKDFGIIVAPPGSGKTIMALKIIAQRKQPALIIVHRKQLLDQWVERIEAFLKIPKKEIGIISGGKIKAGEKITVAMMQSLSKGEIRNKIRNIFSLVIVDECHHIPAKSFRKTITAFNPKYLYGLTATPKRKHNDERMIFAYIGQIIATVNTAHAHTQQNRKTMTIKIKNTSLYLPFDYRTDDINLLYRVLTHDSSRNMMITADVTKMAQKGGKVLVLTERIEHINILQTYLKDKLEIITISGEDTKKDREAKMQKINEGDFQTVISTGQFFGEGTDVPHFDCLLLVFPFSFEGKLKQYIGRIERTKNTPYMIDYRDIRIEFLEKLFKNRNRYYKKTINTNYIIEN